MSMGTNSINSSEQAGRIDYLNNNNLTIITTLIKDVHLV